MSIIEFNKLAQKEQLEITWAQGILEGHHGYGEHYYLLYQLYDFFVEVEFAKSTDEILSVKCFR
jgi:hypothetical protein